MVSFDDIDIAILSYIADTPYSTVTDCAKSIFNPDTTEELQKKDAMLRHRFKSLEDQYLISSTMESNAKHFKINSNKVNFSPNFSGIRFGMKNIHNSKIKGDYCIIIYTDDSVIVRSLDKLEKKWN